MSMQGVGLLPDGRDAIETRSILFPDIGQQEREVPGQGDHPARPSPSAGGTLHVGVQREAEAAGADGQLLTRRQVWEPSYAT